MQRLVGALLFLARDHVENREYCDIAVVLEEILPLYRGEINKKEIDLDVTTQPTPVVAPSGIVDCVLHNLLENALEHTTVGTIAVHVDGQRIVVRDTGSGIAPEAQQHIFDRRYRSPGGNGMGIGLYLVQRICNRLDWEIRVDSQPGVGTTFTIGIRNQPSPDTGFSELASG